MNCGLGQPALVMSFPQEKQNRVSLHRFWLPIFGYSLSTYFFVATEHFRKETIIWVQTLNSNFPRWNSLSLFLLWAFFRTLWCHIWVSVERKERRKRMDKLPFALRHAWESLGTIFRGQEDPMCKGWTIPRLLPVSVLELPPIESCFCLYTWAHL